MKRLLAALLVSAAAFTAQSYTVNAGPSESVPAAAVQQQADIIVDGKALSQPSYEINGCTLVPARAVSDALGFKITWNGDDQSADIISDTMKMNVKVGDDSYMATSIIAIGATAPAHFGAAPLLINDTLYVPAQIFRIIQGNDPDTVKESGSQVIINKAPAKEPVPMAE